MPEALLTIDDLAAMLRTTREGVYAMRYRGEGPPAVKVSKRVLFRSEDVTAWLAKHLQPAS